MTKAISVHDMKTRSLNLLFVYHLDYRPRQTPAVGNVVAFSEPSYAATRTEKIQLATPAYYRREEELKPGIRDQRDGTLTKDGTIWASAIVPSVDVKDAKLSFASSYEPWVYCVAHYRNNRELRRLRDYFMDEYEYTTATGITGPEAFAIWLGIDFALILDKTNDVRLGILDMINYECTRYNTTSLWDGSNPTNITIVRVYHGPVQYEDCSGRIDAQEQFFDPFAGPKEDHQPLS